MHLDTLLNLPLIRTYDYKVHNDQWLNSVAIFSLYKETRYDCICGVRRSSTWAVENKKSNIQKSYIIRLILQYET